MGKSFEKKCALYKLDMDWKKPGMMELVNYRVSLDLAWTSWTMTCWMLQHFNPSVPIRNTGKKKWPSCLKFMSHTVMTVQRISNTRMYAEATYILHSRTQIKPRTNSKPSFWKIIPNLCHQYVLFKSNLSNPFKLHSRIGKKSSNTRPQAILGPDQQR